LAKKKYLREALQRLKKNQVKIESLLKNEFVELRVKEALLVTSETNQVLIALLEND
jgi:hypothetical protein